MKERAIPKIKLLDEEQQSFIHRNSLRILSEIGVRVESIKVRELFAEAIGISAQAETIRIPADLVEWAIQSAPSTITLFNRYGKESFCLGTDAKGEGGAVFGIGVTNTHYQDYRTDRLFPFTREHMKISSRLGDALSEFDVVSTIGIPSDVDPEVADLYGTLDMFANTTKTLVILIMNDRSIPSVFELISRINTNPPGKSSFVTYVNPVTPLILNDGTVEKMIHSIELGYPVIFSNYSMYGATTPEPAVGTLSLMNAELLAGLVLSQLMREGAPIILGSLPASFDMITMGSPFTSRTFLLNLACAEMMDHYGLPHCGTSGSGAGWGADLPAADMLWMNHLTSSLGSVGLVPFVGSNFESLAFSPAMAIHSNQVIRQVREFCRGIELGHFTDSFNEIMKAGPGGNFLTSEQTLNEMESFIMPDRIWQGMTVEKWESEGNPAASERLKAYADKLMNRLQPPDDYDQVMEKGEEMIRKLIGKR